jgi:hypothetical protein
VWLRHLAANFVAPFYQTKTFVWMVGTMFSEAPKTARETRAVPSSNCMVPAKPRFRSLSFSTSGPAYHPVSSCRAAAPARPVAWPRAEANHVAVVEAPGQAPKREPKTANETSAANQVNRNE